MRRAVPVLLLWVAAGCASEVVDDGPLTELEGWVELGPAEDPYEDRPADASCEPFGWKIEDGVLEVETDVCDYVTLEQGLLRDVRAGERVVVDVWNLGLWAEERAVAHVSVQLGDDRWEGWADIPSSAGRWQAVFEVDRRLPAGTPIYLHLHNHGANSWRFGPPTARP